jgi:hypothetical protein
MKRHPPADLPQLVEQLARMKARQDRLARARFRLSKDLAATADKVLTMMQDGSFIPPHLASMAWHIVDSITTSPRA